MAWLYIIYENKDMSTKEKITEFSNWKVDLSICALERIVLFCVDDDSVIETPPVVDVVDDDDNLVVETPPVADVTDEIFVDVCIVVDVFSVVLVVVVAGSTEVTIDSVVGGFDVISVGLKSTVDSVVGGFDAISVGLKSTVDSVVDGFDVISVGLKSTVDSVVGGFDATSVGLKSTVDSVVGGFDAISVGLKSTAVDPKSSVVLDKVLIINVLI